MKKLMCLIALGLFFPGSVIGQSATKPFFDPVQARADSCQHAEKIKGILSCEQEGGTDCALSTNYVIPPLSGIFFRTIGTAACSFECVIGQELCDENLNPDKRKGLFAPVVTYEYNGIHGESGYDDNNCGLDVEGVGVTIMEITEQIDEEGNTYRTKNFMYDSADGRTTCESVSTYLMVCDENDENCKELEIYSEEWYEHQKQAQLKKYKESCFIPTAEDCSDIAEKRAQCLQDVATVLEKAFCSSTNPQLHEELRKLLERSNKGEDPSVYGKPVFWEEGFRMNDKGPSS